MKRNFWGVWFLFMMAFVNFSCKADNPKYNPGETQPEETGDSEDSQIDITQEIFQDTLSEEEPEEVIDDTGADDTVEIDDTEPDILPPDTDETTEDTTEDTTEEIIEDTESPDTEETEELMEEIIDVEEEEVEIIIPNPLDDIIPPRINVIRANTDPGDRVTFRKIFMIDIEDLEVFPENWTEEVYWSDRFPASVVMIGVDDTRTPVPFKQKWLPHDPDKRYSPAIMIEPLPKGWPKAVAMELTLYLGEDEELVIPFRTMPVQYDQFTQINVTVPLRDCPTCFPYEVDMYVFLPPGYLDDNPEINNPAIHMPGTELGDDLGGSPTQKYPVAVLLHTAGDYQNNISLATAAGRRIAWGYAEPMIFALPSGKLRPEYCSSHPELAGCHTRFVGLWRPDETIFSYMEFLAVDMRKYLREHFRIRGSEGVEITDEQLYRRSHSLYGASAGGYGVLINAFSRPEAYYAAVSIVPGVPSAYNPWSNYGGGYRTRAEVCPDPDNHVFPLVRSGLGFRDYTGVDPDTDRTRIVHFADRHVHSGAHNCYQGLPVIEHQLVAGGVCLLDITCVLDPEAPPYVAKTIEMAENPYHGNLYYDTGIFDVGGPPAAFIDLDEVMDRGGIPHTFRYEDHGGLFHDWRAVDDRYLGYEYVQNQRSLPLLRGNFPGPGSVYPFMSRAMEGVGNPVFNSPNFSEYTVSAIDVDRDGIIYFDDPERPEDNHHEDNCPFFYNRDQTDKDADGLGDDCDDDIDGDGIPNEDDDCNWPSIPINPADPEGEHFPSCVEDMDGDGIPDEIDICPEVFNPFQHDTDRDNRGDVCEPDDDNDTINDEDDNCPLDANENQEDIDGNGLGDICDPACTLRPQIDYDQDGVICGEDCNDSDAGVFPGATEVCGDEIDNDCNGVVDDGC